MKLIASLHTFGPGLDRAPHMHTAKRKAFRSRAAAMAQCEKWARQSLRRFAPAAQRVTIQSWGATAGAFPFYYVRAVVTMA